MEQGIMSRILLMLFFGLAGFVYSKSGKKRAIARTKPFGFTLTLTAIIFLMLTFVSGVQGRPFVLLPLACACCFVLPSVLNQTWRAYYSIPEKQFPVWFSAEEDLVPAEIRPGPSVGIHFDVWGSGVKANSLMLFTTLPADAPLGEGFVGALLRHNDKFPATSVTVTDGQGHPFGWQFYNVRLKGVKKEFIDPKTILGSPEMKNRNHIIVKRCHSQRPVVYRMKAR